MDTRDLPGFTLRLGPLSITWSSLFGARLKYTPRSYTGERLPLFERLTTMQETEEPWRKGHGCIMRLWPTSRAIMVGWWGAPQVDDLAGDRRALAQVLQGSASGYASNIPVTNLLGNITEDELLQRVERQIDPDSDEGLIVDDFEIIDMRDGKAL